MPGFWELPEAEHVGHTADLRDLGSFRHGITFHNYRFRVVLASVPIELARASGCVKQICPLFH